MSVRIKRIYETPSTDDGFRILVDRIWPRGVSKERAQVDVWLKEVGPSTELRTWFHHEAPKWARFREKYRVELAVNSSFEELKVLTAEHPVTTLVYSAKDETENQAVVLKELLDESGT